MTQKGYDEALKRLEELKNLRDEIAQEIGRARAFGDISENAEYDAAKDKQGMNERRIHDLENQLAVAQIMGAHEVLPTDKVLVGITVTIEDVSDGEVSEYTMVSPLEADPDQGRISIQSPLGQALLGRAVGDIAELKVPRGAIKYKITRIERR
jgi:transcription elongation factor GreA